MSDTKTIYSNLCRLCVFDKLLSDEVFRAFFKFCEAKEEAEKLKAYSSFVSCIYSRGGCLTDIVKKSVFEDENVYIKSASQGININTNIQRAVEFELQVLSVFASLVTEDFSKELGDDEYIPSFDSYFADIKNEYYERVAHIGRFGFGIFASSGMFRLDGEGNIVPIEAPDKTSIDSFVGYAEERQKVLQNTLMLLEGRPAANALLYGDAGTGKSSTVKAIANHLYSKGLRLIEVRKNQLLYLPKIMGQISKNPLKFVIFIDDLSFNSNDANFSMLKATLEGSAAAKAENAVIYATSNRRHIIKESFGEREGSDIHRNDTVQETLSLSERFGLRVLFAKPEKKLYLEIVHELASRRGIDIPHAQLDVMAEAFVLRHGYRSARCAEQFVDSLT